MSRLWPEPIQIGLFPGHCWLRRGKAAEQSFQHPPSADPAALLRALEKMLDGQAPPLRKGSRLALTVSDSMASIAALPWQEQLSSPAEIDSYARICFEKLGLTLGDKWVTHTEFRHYGGTGLAYALPRDWLEALLELIRARGHILTAVLPVTAAAYSRQRFTEEGARALLFLQEMHRTSTMIFDQDGLLGYDVEPLISSAAETRARLLSRAASAYGNITRAFLWSTESLASELPDALVGACLPNIKLRCLKRDVWN